MTEILHNRSGGGQIQCEFKKCKENDNTLNEETK